MLCFVLQRTPTNENNGGTEWRVIQQLLLDGEMGSEGNACVKTLPDTNSVSVLLNYGIIFASVPYYQGLEGVGGGWGVLILPSASHTIFITFSVPCTLPPTGLGAG